MTLDNILLLFSPGIAGILILSAAGAFARTRVAVIWCGVIAALLFVAECLWFLVLPAVFSGGHAHGDLPEEYYWIPCMMLLGFAVVTWLYFIYGFRRARRHDNAA